MAKEAWQDCILSPCLLNFQAEYIMKNAKLDESHAGIKTAGRKRENNKKLLGKISATSRYEDNTTLTAESAEQK